MRYMGEVHARYTGLYFYLQYIIATFAPQLAAGVGSCGASFVMGPHFCEERRAAHYYSQLSKKLEEMRVIIESGDKPEARELIYALQKYGVQFVIVEEETKQVHRLLSNNEFRTAICKVLQSFTVGTQWVAVYRILVDFYGFPEAYDAFCDKIEKLMKGVNLTFPSDYQAIQKPLASCSILQKHYDQWKVYVVKKGDRIFPRQKKIADMLFEALENA